MSKNVNVKEFIAAQRRFDNATDLADYLGKSIAVVQQRMKKLRENGFAAYLRPYNDNIKRGRKKLADQFAELTTWEHDEREQLLMEDEEMRRELSVQ